MMHGSAGGGGGTPLAHHSTQLPHRPPNCATQNPEPRTQNTEPIPHTHTPHTRNTSHPPLPSSVLLCPPSRLPSRLPSHLGLQLTLLISLTLTLSSFSPRPPANPNPNPNPDSVLLLTSASSSSTRLLCFWRRSLAEARLRASLFCRLVSASCKRWYLGGKEEEGRKRHIPILVKK